jgi:hypothetical protein
MPDLFEQEVHDAGGRSLMRLPAGVKGAAVFGGPRDCYRYELERVWDETLPTMLIVGMNPSMAGPNRDDPTSAKATRIARRFGFGRVYLGNVHGYRVTDQTRLLEVADPVGPQNDTHLLFMAARSEAIVMAYGTPKLEALCLRGPRVARMLMAHGHELTVLQLSKDGVPMHPRFLPEDLSPRPWGGPDQPVHAKPGTAA